MEGVYYDTSSVFVGSNPTRSENIKEHQPIVSVSEIWENESWKPLRRIWSSAMGNPSRFTDRSGVIALSSGEDFPVFYAPRGWEWSSDWAVDMSGRFGKNDTEGYFYASSYDTLVDQTEHMRGVGESSTCFMRRRRFYILCSRNESSVNLPFILSCTGGYALRYAQTKSSKTD